MNRLSRISRRLDTDHPCQVVERLNKRFPHYDWRAGSADGYTPAFAVWHGELIEYCYKPKERKD